MAMVGLSAFALTGSAGPWPLHDLVPAWDRGSQAHALSREPTAADAAAGRRLEEFVAGSGGPVLSEVAGFVLSSGATVAGNPMLLKGLGEHGMYDSSQLVSALQRRSIKGVILLGQSYPPEVLQAIGANYQQVDRITMAGNDYLLFRPKT
jgi:hypothetical protein